MNELISTLNNEQGDIIVSGRELHEFLGVKTDYKDWFPRMVEYGFIEGLDFISISEKVEAQKRARTYEQKNHHLKIDMAKEISMLQRTEKGKQARQYFLQLEKMWNSPEMVMKRALQFADQKVLELQAKIEADKSKVFFAEAVGSSKNSILVKDLATLLKQNGCDIGQNRLFTWLRENDYLCKAKAFKNKPTQRAMDMKLFEVKEHIHSGNDGEIYTKFTPKVTGKGQVYFIEKLAKKEL